MRTFSVRRLSTSRNDHVNPRRKKNTLEDGWSTDLTTLGATMRKTHSYADLGDQVSWAEYDEEFAWELMTERRWSMWRTSLATLTGKIMETNSEMKLGGK